MKDIAIVSSVRTAIGKGIKGSLRDTRPDTLGAVAVKEALRRSGVAANEIDDVVIGCAMPEAEQGMNFARTIALLAGIPHTASAVTVNRFCSSGLHAVADVAKSIQVGQIKIGIAGGAESMSMVPMGGHRPSASPELMEMLPAAYVPMGLTAENVAKQFGITRAMQDEFSVESHKRAVNAIEKGFFKDEIVPMKISVMEEGEKKTMDFATDEGPRRDTSLEALTKLKPAFDMKGTVTAGNASQMSDGGAACVMMDAADAKARNLKPMALFRSFATAGVPPEIMGIGPVPAIEKLLAMNGLRKDDIGVFEINEAFAAQVVYCIQKLGLDPAKVNACGGAVALGHPLGCTGARQVATIIREMQRRKAKYGIVSMCIGGGMGAAGLIELAA